MNQGTGSSPRISATGREKKKNWLGQEGKETRKQKMKASWFSVITRRAAQEIKKRPHQETERVEKKARIVVKARP